MHTPVFHCYAIGSVNGTAGSPVVSFSAHCGNCAGKESDQRSLHKPNSFGSDWTTYDTRGSVAHRCRSTAWPVLYLKGDDPVHIHGATCRVDPGPAASGDVEVKRVFTAAAARLFTNNLLGNSKELGVIMCELTQFLVGNAPKGGVPVNATVTSRGPLPMHSALA